MSKNKVQNLFVGPIKDTQNKQKEHHSNYYRGRHRTVMFVDYVTVLTLSGVSSDATWTDLDLSSYKETGGSGDISDDSIAVILRASAQDSGSAAAACSLQVRPNGSAISAPQLMARGTHINNSSGIAQGIIKLDSDFIIEHRRVATGAGTLTASLEIIGYIEQLS